MKRIICLVLILALMGTGLNFHVFAAGEQQLITKKEIIHVDEEGNLIVAKISTKNYETIVDVYINNQYDHTAITNTKNDSITVEHSGIKGKKAEYLKLSDIVIEPDSNDYGIYDDYPPSTPPGYSFSTSEYSPYHGARGYLFERLIGDVANYSHKRVQLTVGTAVGVVIGVLTTFITGDVTLGALMFAMGSSIASGALTSWIDSDVHFVDVKTLYKGFCRGVETLNTNQVVKYARVYNYKNSRETREKVGYKSGYRGTKADIAYGAIVNYFN